MRTKIKNFNTFILEDITHKFSDSGGSIIFSTEVNAVNGSDNVIFNKLDQVMKSLTNKIFFDRKLNGIMKTYAKGSGFTIGKFVKGRYIAENGEIFDEKSITIEVIGISSEVLLKIAENIAKEFKQETVLVKDYQKNYTCLVNGEESIIINADLKLRFDKIRRKNLLSARSEWRDKYSSNGNIDFNTDNLLSI
tara:strand:+ start:49248 stop:49826 length:579 start_codon:yes stop_codon:yes gene_type:complete